MIVRYKGAWAAVMLTLGGLSILMMMILLAMGGRLLWGSLIAGVICTFVGLGYLRKPYFEVLDDHLLFRAVLGPLTKQYPFESTSEVEVRDGKVFIKGKKLGISSWLANNDDWSAFAQRMNAAETFE